MFDMTQMASDPYNGGVDVRNTGQDDMVSNSISDSASLCIPEKETAPSVPVEEDTNATNEPSSEDTGEGNNDQTNKEGVDVNFVFCTEQVPSESQSQPIYSPLSMKKRSRPDDFDDTSEDAQLEETNNNY